MSEFYDYPEDSSSEIHQTENFSDPSQLDISQIFDNDHGVQKPSSNKVLHHAGLSIGDNKSGHEILQKLKNKSNKPKIVLETMSGRQTMWVLGLTWAGFIISIVLGVVENRSNHTRVLNLYPPSGTALGIYSTFKNTTMDGSLGWIFNSYVNNHLLDELSGMVSLSMKLRSAASWIFVGDPFYYNLELLACTNPDTLCQDNQLQQVLSLSHIAINSKRISDSEVSLFSTYQQQETIINSGTITAYSIQVVFFGNQTTSQSFPEFIDSFALTFHLYNDMKTRQIGSLILLIICVVYGVWWLRVVATYVINDPSIRDRIAQKKNPGNFFIAVYKKILPERKWLVYFLLGVFFIANPVFVFSFFGKVNPAHGFAAAIVQNAGVSLVAYIFLLFADGATRLISQNIWKRSLFYAPKAFPSILAFISITLMDTVHYPSVTHTSRTGLLSAENWSPSLSKKYLVYFAVYIAALLLWLAMMLFYFCRTGRRLATLVYMETRYAQLGFRFYSLQFFLYVVVIALRVSYLAAGSFSKDAYEGLVVNRLSFAVRSPEAVSSLIVYLAALVFVEMYMYLPPEKADLIRPGQGLSLLLFEDEQRPAFFRQNARRSILNLGDWLGETNNRQRAHFVAETALRMMELSWEVYSEPQDIESKSSDQTMPFDPQRLGFELIQWIYKPSQEVNCMILRQTNTNFIVVVFRGTASATQWKTNLDAKALLFDTQTMSLKTEEVPESITSGKNILAEEEHLQRRYSQFGAISKSGSEAKVLEENDGNLDGTFLFRKRPSRSALINLPVTFEELKDNVQKGAKTALGIGEGLIELGVDAVTMGVNTGAEGIRKGAELAGLGYVPGINRYITAKIHSGFWSAYKLAREDIHSIVRKAFTDIPTSKVITVGHSLGGALATCAAMDLATHTLPKLNKHLEKRRKIFEDQERVSKVTLDAYTYGSPRVGNTVFSAAYDKAVPNTFRIQNDGDIVTAVPPAWLKGYKHVGKSIVVCDQAKGKILLNPSFVENRLDLKLKIGVDPHMPWNYEAALCGLYDENLTSKELSDLIANAYKRKPFPAKKKNINVVMKNKSTMTEILEEKQEEFSEPFNSISLPQLVQQPSQDHTYTTNAWSGVSILN